MWEFFFHKHNHCALQWDLGLYMMGVYRFPSTFFVFLGMGFDGAEPGILITDFFLEGCFDLFAFKEPFLAGSLLFIRQGTYHSSRGADNTIDFS